jgi:exodeoxyribonuclease VII small subunit
MTTKKSGDFEKQLARLQVVVEQLEQGELPLDKGVSLYKEGLNLTKACREQLEKARNDISILSDGVFKEFASGEAENMPQEEEPEENEPEDGAEEDEDDDG